MKKYIDDRVIQSLLDTENIINDKLVQNYKTIVYELYVV